MFETIKRLYAKTGDKTIVANAVKKGWITEEQFNEFILAKAKESGELSDEQLEAVSGGDECIGIPIDYADSGSVKDGGEVTFVFSEHQRVLYKLKGNGLAEIISCRIENRYRDYYEKVYGILH